MTRDEWDTRAFNIDAIKAVCAAYRQEHDWDGDDDPVATEDMLREAMAMHDELMRQLGEPPVTEPVEARADLPF